MSLSSHSGKANEKNQMPVIYGARKSRELEKENTRNTQLGLSKQSKCLGKVNGNSHQKAIRTQSRGQSNATGSKSHLVTAGDFLPSTSVSSISNDQCGRRDGRRDGKADLEENLQQFGRNIGNYIRDRYSRPGNRVPVHELNEELRKANMALKQKGGGTKIGRIWKLFRLVEGSQHFNAITIDSYKEITKNKRITDNAEEYPIQRPTVIMTSAGVSAKKHTDTDEEVQILDEEEMNFLSVPCDVQDLWIVEDDPDASFQKLDSQLAEVFHEEPQDDGETAYDLSIQNVGQTYATETKTMFEQL